MCLQAYCSCLAEAFLFLALAAAKDTCVERSRWPDSPLNGAVNKAKIAAEAGSPLAIKKAN